MKIPFSGLRKEYACLRREIDDAVRRVLASGWYVLGEEVRRFETECSAYLGIKHVVGVASGTEAIALALWAHGIGAGDEVITTDVTAFPTVSGILMTGAVPVFVDIDGLTGLMDANKVEAAITPKTKAVIPVHLYGQCVPMQRIVEIAKRRGLVVVEDCAQAFGAMQDGKQAGSLGDISAFSFYPTKNLGAAGDGGARDRGGLDLQALLRVRRTRRGGDLSQP